MAGGALAGLRTGSMAGGALAGLRTGRDDMPVGTDVVAVPQVQTEEVAADGSFLGPSAAAS